MVKVKAAGTSECERKRTLQFHKNHARRFALEITARDEGSGLVTAALCLFCKHFGREEKLGRKRKSTTNFKYFKHSFRTDQYMQHHLSQHPTQWARYEAASEDEKRFFFPATAPTPATIVADAPSRGGAVASTGSAAAAAVVSPTGVNAAVSAAVAGLREAAAAMTSVGSGYYQQDQTSSTWVIKREIAALVTTQAWSLRAIGQCDLVSSGDDQTAAGTKSEEPKSSSSAANNAAVEQASSYRVHIYNRAKMDMAVEFMSSGLSPRQIAHCVSAAVKYMPMRMLDPCSELQALEFTQLAVAASWNALAAQLTRGWGFSLVMHRAAMPSSLLQGSMLDIQLRVIVNNAARTFHLVAFPMIEQQSDEVVYQSFARVISAIFPGWRHALLSISYEGLIPLNAECDCVLKLMARIQEDVSTAIPAPAKALYRTWCLGLPLHLAMQGLYQTLLGGNFLSTLASLTAYIRHQDTLVQEMGHPPSSTGCHEWLAIGKDTKWINDKRVRLRKHLEEESSLAIAPDESWWVCFFVVHWIATRVNETVKKLLSKQQSMTLQLEVIEELTTEVMTAFHVEGPFESTEALQAFQANAKGAHYISHNGRFAISESWMHDFIGDLGVFVSIIVARIEAPAYIAVVENMALCVVNWIEALVVLRPKAPASKSPADDVSMDTAEDSSSLPPVLPCDLAQCNGKDFAALLSRHHFQLRSFFSDEQVDEIDQQHQALRQAFAREKPLKEVLTSCDAQTPFESAWKVTDSRFKALHSFAAGLATILPGAPSSVSTDVGYAIGSAAGSVLPLPLTDLVLEGALHGRQFQELDRVTELSTSTSLV